MLNKQWITYQGFFNITVMLIKLFLRNINLAIKIRIYLLVFACNHFLYIGLKSTS